MSRRPAPPRARSGAVGAGPGPARRPARPGGPARTARPQRPAGSRPPTRASRLPAGAELPGDEDEPRPLRLARLLSVRALVLAVVLLVCFTMLLPTVRAYLGQQAELDALAAEVAAAEQRERELEGERARWDDPAYIEAQARDRLNYAQPGETPFRVIDPEIVVDVPVEGAVAGSVPGPVLPIGGAVTPWYATVWESVRVAGQAPMPGATPVAPAPTPAPDSGGAG